MVIYVKILHKRTVESLRLKELTLNVAVDFSSIPAGMDTHQPELRLRLPKKIKVGQNSVRCAQ